MNNDDRYLEVAVAAAKEAGRIQKAHFGHSHAVEYKGDIDLVTVVDKLCDETVSRQIRSAFPDHDLMTEESSFETRNSRWKWIVDPLDGTTNYFRGYPCFCVSIGLEEDGEMKVGVVYNPLLDELFHGERGKGAYLNGQRMLVSRVTALDQAFLGTGFPYDIRQNADFYLGYFSRFIRRSLGLRRAGSAALDLCYVAAGRFDGFWEFNLHAWDVAAGSLLVTEAGGMLTDFKRQPFSIYSKEILASNGLIHDQMLQVIKESEAPNTKYQITNK